MSNQAWSALGAQLRAVPPASLERLTSDDLVDLAQAVRAARRHQAAQLKAAGDQAFGHIPRILRGPIRKLLG